MILSMISNGNFHNTTVGMKIRIKVSPFEFVILPILFTNIIHCFLKIDKS